MRIHSDILTKHDLYNALNAIHRPGGFNSPRLVTLECMQHGSRSRARAFEVGLEWQGEKAKGDGRHKRNSGQYGAHPGWAASYDEWGEWLAALYDIDPQMKATYYDGRADFISQTMNDRNHSRRKGAKYPWLS